MLPRTTLGLALLVFAVACSSKTDGPPTNDPSTYKGTPLPPLPGAPTTVDATIAATHAKQPYTAGPNPSDYAALAPYLTGGFGESAPGPGQAYLTRVIDGSTPPAPGPNAKRILRFTTLSDLQTADDESPTRLGLFDSADITSSALRPQDMYLCRMANAAVRTINVLNKQDPIAFTLMGGDITDSAQTNELEWAMAILDGAPQVKCDSGAPDDPVAGPDNDGKDPFVAEGLAMPWKWVMGNHDVLVQGNLQVTVDNQATAVGTEAGGGTRNYADMGAVESGDFVVPDAKRMPLMRQDMITKVMNDKDGHGLTAAEQMSGRATYTFDVDGTPFRFLVLDTCHELGGADGVIRQVEIDRVIKPALDKAMADGKYVILASHHAVQSLTADGGTFGKVESDALLADAWETFIGGYPNVLFSMVGHTHANEVNPITPKTGHAWWEVMTAAIADFPHEFRLVEVYDQDNGWLMMRTSAVDFNAVGDPVAEEGRRRGIVDLTSGWLPRDGTGNPEDRNVELWIKKPN